MTRKLSILWLVAVVVFFFLYWLGATPLLMIAALVAIFLSLLFVVFFAVRNLYRAGMDGHDK